MEANIDKPEKDEKKTITYKVNKDCYWNDHLYHEDDIVKLPESAKPPKQHFDVVK